MDREFGKLSICTPTRNEELNVDELVARVRTVMQSLRVDYEHIIIDNASSDGTAARLKQLAAEDSRIRVILNQADYGQVRSPIHGMLQSTGDATIMLTADLQDPPELIPDLLTEWRHGAKVVFLVKKSSEDNWIVRSARNLYYALLGRLTHVPLVPRATGAGLYDREVVETLRDIGDPEPYVRGLVVELGFPIGKVYFDQPPRARGRSNNNLWSLFSVAMLGISTTSRSPLRAMSFAGLILGLASLAVGLIYFFLKLLNWDSFDLGLAPIAVGLFFLGAVQLFCIGILGEYIGNIFVHVRRHPLVIEQTRINFPPQGHTNGPPSPYQGHNTGP